MKRILFFFLKSLCGIYISQENFEKATSVATYLLSFNDLTKEQRIEILKLKLFCVSVQDDDCETVQVDSELLDLQGMGRQEKAYELFDVACEELQGGSDNLALEYFKEFLVMNTPAHHPQLKYLEVLNSKLQEKLFQLRFIPCQAYMQCEHYKKALQLLASQPHHNLSPFLVQWVVEMKALSLYKLGHKKLSMQLSLLKVENISSNDLEKVCSLLSMGIEELRQNDYDSAYEFFNQALKYKEVHKLSAIKSLVVHAKTYSSDMLNLCQNRTSLPVFHRFLMLNYLADQGRAGHQQSQEVHDRLGGVVLLKAQKIST